MQKLNNKFVVVLLMAMVASLATLTVRLYHEKTKPTKPLVLLETPEVPYSVEEDVLWMMDRPKCQGAKADKISDVSRVFLAKQVDRIVTSQGGTTHIKQGFVWLICQESQFRSNAKSPANAFGLTQMILGTAQGEATKLGLGKITEQDLYNTEISITLGYAHFKYLSEKFNGNIARAAAAYNGGEAGATLKAMKQGGQGVPETNMYVVSLFDATEERRIAKETPAVASK